MGGAFLLPPTGKSQLPDEHFAEAVHLRLQLLRRGAVGFRRPASICRHRSSRLGQWGNCGVDDRGHHALTCEVGAAFRGHTRRRDWLAVRSIAITGALQPGR